MGKSEGQDEILSKLPRQGFIFWPVGTGDSTTVCIGENVFMQIDLHHLDESENEDNPKVPIVDKLVDLLPEKDGKPYLSVFVLTHPDLDHCRGFRLLRDRVTIGELWFSPRIFREHSADLCDDAKAFRREAKRRVAATIAADGTAESGNRVRIIGYSDLLEEDDFKGFPLDRLQSPGDEICEVDGVNVSGSMCAFVHAPFKDDDIASERNETSVGLRIELKCGDSRGRAMLLGDLSYPTVLRVFRESHDHNNDDALHWDIFLAPHQCSKSVMYWQGEGEEEATLKQDILDEIETAGGDVGHIIASSNPIPASNQDGDNPPHALAKERYQEIAPDGFLCTGEHPTQDKPTPLVFELDEDGLKLRSNDASGDQSGTAARSAVALGIEKARGEPAPPSQPIGYGNSR